MSVVGTAFPLILLLTGLCSLAFGALAWRKRGEPGGTPLVVYNVAIAVAMFAYAVDITSTSRSTQILMLSVWLPAQALVATTWVYVAIEYAGLEQWSNRRTVALLWLEPAVFAVIVVVPGTRQLLFELPETGIEGSIFFAGATGTALLSAHYIFLFVAMLAATLLLIRLFVRSKHLYRIQAASVGVAAVAPWTLLLVQAVGVAPTEDPSAIAFAISGMALTVGLYRFKELDPVPPARETIIKEMGDGVIVLDEDGIVSSLNPAARELLAPSTAEETIVGTPVANILPEWERLAEPAPDLNSDARSDGSPPLSESPPPAATEWREFTLSVNGTERFLECQISPFYDRFDRLVGRFVLLRDVTERTRREQKLARYKTIFESVTDRVYVLDEDGRFVVVNEPFASLVGTAPDSLRGKPFSSVLTPSTADDFEGSADSHETVEVEIETTDDECIPCEIRRAPISFEGMDSGSVGILRDISQRKEIESSLQRTTERLQTLVEASPLAIVGTDPEGRIEVWNEAATEMFGWLPEEVIGEFVPIVSEEQAETARDLFERVTDGERITGKEMELDRADGGVVDASLSLAPVTDKSGTVRGVVSIIADISDQKERERQLERQNERLDEFAGLVSHDLRNPLEVGSTHLELLRIKADIDPEAAEHVEKSEAAFERMETLIDDTLTLAREGKDIGERRPLALDDIANRAWESVATPGATLEIETEATEPLDGDSSRVLELFENLFRNSIEHGRSELEAAKAQPEAAEQTAASTPEAGLTVRVKIFDGGFAVEDNGEGIDDTDRDQLFEPGYTTEADGTGFGLAIVKRIADAHDWNVTVGESDAGGARFEFKTA